MVAEKENIKEIDHSLIWEWDANVFKDGEKRFELIRCMFSTTARLMTLTDFLLEGNKEKLLSGTMINLLDAGWLDVAYRLLHSCFDAIELVGELPTKEDLPVTQEDKDFAFYIKKVRKYAASRLRQLKVEFDERGVFKD